MGFSLKRQKLNGAFELLTSLVVRGFTGEQRLAIKLVGQFSVWNEQPAYLTLIRLVAVALKIYFDK